MFGPWDRTCRWILEIASDDRSELLHRLLLALGEHETGLDTLNAALDDFGAARGERLAGLEALSQLHRITREARHG